MNKKLIAVAVLAAMLSACGSLGKINQTMGDRGLPKPTHNGTFLPGGALKIGPNYSVAYMDMILVAGMVALVYQVVDPAAPAWEILEVRLPNRRVQYTLRMQYIHNGGEGEARQVLARRASALAREEGMTGYEIQSFTESIDSRLFLPRRTAEAEVLMQYVEPVKIHPSAVRPALAGM